VSLWRAARATVATACAGALVSVLAALTNACGSDSIAASDASSGSTIDVTQPSDGSADRPVDAGAEDVALAEGGPACAPVARAFTPHPQLPIPFKTVCHSELIHPILDCYFTTPYDPVACDGLLAPTGEQAECLACLFSSDASAPAPLAWFGANAELNVAGCVQALLPTDTGCAQGLADIAECTRAACSHCAALGENVLDECRTAAQASVCAATVTQSGSCTRALGPDGGAKDCDPAGSFVQAASVIGIKFCGGYNDAGTD